MTSQRWSKIISVLVFGLVLATAGSAQAQWVYPPVGQFGVGYGAVPGYSPFGYGAFGAGGYGVPGNFIGFPAPGYAQSLGLVPQTTTSFPSIFESVTSVPAWSGAGYGAYRPHRARPVVRRAANSR